MITKKYKYFWLLILIFSVSGAFYGRYIKEQKNLIRKHSDFFYTTNKNIETMSITAVKSEQFLDEYIKSIYDEYSTTINYPSLAILEGKKVYLLEEITSEVFKIAVFNKERTHTRPEYYECYIWKGFLENPTIRTCNLCP